jgi:lantibiotic modifying enzyme
LAVAAEIGDVLCRDALWDGNRCAWGGASIEPIEGQWVPVWRTFGPTLYDGSAGTALFLARLYAATRDPKHAIAAEGGIRQALSLEQATPRESALGFYAGNVGIAFASEAVGRLLGRPDISAEARAVARRLFDADPAMQQSDVVSGLAGAVPALLALAQGGNAAGLRELAMRLGDELIAKAHRHDATGGWSWGMTAVTPEAGFPVDDGPDLVGYSHGTAGIAAALLELHAVCGEARFREAAAQALAYERRWYSPAERNWPDLRSFGEQPKDPPGYPVSWCHGAAGIGFARLRSFSLTGDPALRAEAEIAIDTTARLLEAMIAPEGDPRYDANFCLCHGLGGNADLLLYASEVLVGTPEAGQMAARARAVGDLGVARHGRRAPWPCGIPGAGETPGLLIGLAGIGYFYLRLHDSAATPTPLLIDPSRA